MKPKLSAKEAEPNVPADLGKALAATPKVMAMWKSLTPIGRRDFIFWINSAKQAATRKHRIDTLGSRLAAGKRRPCCFSVVPMSLYKALGMNPKAKAKWKDMTPNQRRDYIDWINASKQPGAQKSRVGEVCMMIAAGKRCPL